MAPIPQSVVAEIAVISRSEAIERGLKKYFTGKPCIRGHIAERKTVNCNCSECDREKDRKFYKKNAEMVKDRVLKHANKNREAINKRKRELAIGRTPEIVARKKAWRASNKEHVRLKGRQYASTRRARKIKSSGDYSKDDVLRLILMQKNKCANCSKNVGDKFHVDHIVPLAKGGSNEPNNIQILCPYCNLSKHSMDPFDWAKKNGKLL